MLDVVFEAVKRLSSITAAFALPIDQDGLNFWSMDYSSWLYQSELVY